MKPRSAKSRKFAAINATSLLTKYNQANNKNFVSFGKERKFKTKQDAILKKKGVPSIKLARALFIRFKFKIIWAAKSFNTRLYLTSVYPHSLNFSS